VFIAWVLTRELDPDFSPSAMVAAVLTLIGIIVLDGRTDIVAVGTLIFVVRIVVRSTGIPYYLTDGLWTLALGLYLATTPFWMLGLIVGFCFLVDSQLNRPKKYSRPLGAVSVVSTLIIAAYGGQFDKPDLSATVAEILVVALAALALEAVNYTTPIRMESLGDYTGDPLNRRRVVMGRRLLLLGAILPLLWIGESGAEKMIPLWAGFAALIPLHLGRQLI
jgi:hypothetical protein